MISLSSFQLEVLDCVLDDYELPSTIVVEVSRAVGRTVSQSEVAGALTSLCILGVAQAYVFDQRVGSYLPVSLAQAPRDGELWFLATPAGQST